MKKQKISICLRALNAATLESLILPLEKALPQRRTKRFTKEKYYRDNDMYKYDAVRFYDDLSGLRVSCRWGSLVVQDKLLPLSDIVISYRRGHSEKALTLVRRLLKGKLHFILEEPRLGARLDQLRGCFNLEAMAMYDASSAATACVCHLPWQIYAVSKAWGDLLSKPQEKALVRQLRVKLRRLRSVAALFRPLVSYDKDSFWRRSLKEHSDKLAAAREYDVAILTCERLRRNSAELELDEDNSLGALTGLLQKKRGAIEQQLAQALTLNAVTAELAEMLLYWQNAPLVAEYKKYSLQAYLCEELGLWCERLLGLSERYPDLTDMEQLHQIRIKIKQFRYCVQGLPEINVPPSLLRTLKILQDQLGLLHDNYVNDDLLTALLEEHSGDKGLRYECAMFGGWERAKVDAALGSVPASWQNFCKQLKIWRDENL